MQQQQQQHPLWAWGSGLTVGESHDTQHVARTPVATQPSWALPNPKPYSCPQLNPSIPPLPCHVCTWQEAETRLARQQEQVAALEDEFGHAQGKLGRGRRRAVPTTSCRRSPLH